MPTPPYGTIPHPNFQTSLRFLPGRKERKSIVLVRWIRVAGSRCCGAVARCGRELTNGLTTTT